MEGAEKSVPLPPLLALRSRFAAMVRLQEGIIERLRMPQMDLEIVVVLLVKLRRIVQHEQILSIGVLGLLGEIETAGDDGAAIDQH